MFRKLMWATVAAVALLAPLTLAGTASAHEFHHDRRFVVRTEWRARAPVVKTVTTVRTTRTVTVRR